MRVSQKLFFTIAAIIISLSLIFICIVQFALRDSLYSMMEAARSEEVESLQDMLTSYYETNNRSWDGIGQFIDDNVALASDAGLVVRDRNMSILAQSGAMPHSIVIDDGLRSVIRIKGNYVAAFFLYDDDIANMSTWRKSSYYSTLFFMVFGVIVLVALSLLMAYWLSKRLTAPLNMLLPAIERLKRGELGVHAPVLSADEYGKVAAAFNDMSRELLHAEHVRRSLVADVAHELRTPLTIMSGKLELYQQNKTPIKPSSLLPIQDELLRLTTLVEELHQISLAEAKKLPLQKKAVDVNDWVSRMADHVREEAELQHIVLDVNVADKPVVANMDANRMTQVLMNLLGNALRHTPPHGSITVQVKLNESGSSPPHATISIMNTGEGIAAEHLPYLFDRFYRADDDRSRTSGGMGLGLAISKQLTEAHGGSISVESEPNVSTTFYIGIPLEQDPLLS